MNVVRLYQKFENGRLPYHYPVEVNDQGEILVEDENGTMIPLQENEPRKFFPQGSKSCGIMEPRTWVPVIQDEDDNSWGYAAVPETN